MPEQEEKKELDEKVQDEQGQEPEEKEQDQEEDSGADEQFYDDEAEYLRAMGIDGFESVDEAMAELKKLKATQNRPVESRQDEEPEVKKRVEKQDRESPFGRGHMKAYIDEMVRNGQLSSSDAQQFWRGSSAMMDAVLDKILDTQERVMGGMAAQVSQLTGDAREGSWQRFKRKPYFPKSHDERGLRRKLDSILDQSGEVNYERAWRSLAMSDEAAFEELLNAQADQQKPKPKLPKFSGGRRGEARRSTGIDPELKPLLNRDGTLDTDRFNRLSDEKRMQLAKAYVEFEKSRQG